VPLAVPFGTQYMGHVKAPQIIQVVENGDKGETQLVSQRSGSLGTADEQSLEQEIVHH
jgi:hypothetical protein